MTVPVLDSDLALSVSVDSPCNVVLFNDDVNTFPFVIRVLMHVVKVSYEQAAELANAVHTTGRAVVFSGPISDATDKATALSSAGLTVEVQR